MHSSIAIILIGKRALVALLNLSSWCLVMVEPLFLAVPRGCMQFVIVVYIALVRWPPCELNICTSTTAESRAKIWYQ